MKNNNFLKSIGLIFLYLLLNTFFTSFNISIGIESTSINLAVTMIESILILGILTFILRRFLKGQFQDFKKNYRVYLKKAFRYWGYGFIAMIVTNLLINSLFIDGIAPNEEANRIILTTFPLYSILSMCLIGPMSEELLFRLGFRDVFKNRWVYIITTGIIFGSMHVLLSLESVLDLLYIIPYSTLGFAFGACYFDTDNIYTSICAHVFHNVLTIAIIFIGL